MYNFIISTIDVGNRRLNSAILNLIANNSMMLKSLWSPIKILPGSQRMIVVKANGLLRLLKKQTGRDGDELVFPSPVTSEVLNN